MTFSELKALKLQLHRTDSELAAEIRRVYGEAEAAARDDQWFPGEPVEIEDNPCLCSSGDCYYIDAAPEPAWAARLETKLDALLSYHQPEWYGAHTHHSTNYTP